MLDRSSIDLNHPLMNQLTIEQRSRVVAALVEGNSLRSITRMTGVHRTTVMKLLADLGCACSIFQDKAFRNLHCNRIEADEIWSFCGAKEKNTTPETKAKGWGDIWTWTSIDPETKLVPCWFVGARDASAAFHFMHDLSSRMANRIQLTTDGLNLYLPAVADAFGGEVDYAQLVKIYGAPEQNEARYSPAQCMGARRASVCGNPSTGYISTSIAERQNLTMRMSMRRFTRLTNGFSKKVENHEHSVALHFLHYNFCRIHQSLRVTPAVQAGLSNHVWSSEEVISLLDAHNEIAA